ncbi:MAG TPA: arginase family protein [Polyangiaceae bacterium]|nr:arginase family protein [Polyangiaceae bacterium]
MADYDVRSLQARDFDTVMSLGALVRRTDVRPHYARLAGLPRVTATLRFGRPPRPRRRAVPGTLGRGREATVSQTPALAYVRRGLTPFFRLPSIDVERASPCDGLDAVVLGVPFDAATTYRPGARFAPYEVRRVSALVQGFHPVHRVDVFSALRAADGGNVAVPPFSRRHRERGPQRGPHARGSLRGRR